ncbi:hypothetical protein COT62_02355 [Candidatus Roizmanbacteria bacterium CG09_land_8_20_14_0_10_41_9]|uniref:Methyltransferase type 11 domain-containing protein n=1 Tax=Candidatus Roizmanbacteria bacterium CG09_land_8_20_14_0_10_41_9 TaxID=1974850 RepID=A0A2H0WUU2_9BACT|nr:MAG: hypothetical protein COT62_02355 [Candidatus Roizmanbacteria bacterium CG09_land_8_20_14_0_10_41_9]
MSTLKQFRLLISPLFIARYYLIEDLRAILKKYRLKGNLIDIGCGSKPYKNYFSYIGNYRGIDFKTFSRNKDFPEDKPDYYFNHSYVKSLVLPFRDNQFGNAVSFQVLEHHADANRMISEMIRVTKSGGYLLISAPFIASLHESPHDYCRFTEYYFQKILKKYHCHILEIRKQGSLFSTIATLLCDYLNAFAAKNRVFYFFALMIFPPFLLFQYSSLLLDRLFPSDEIFFNYVILARKK